MTDSTPIQHTGNEHDPTLVFVHGFMQRPATWDGVIDAFGRRFHALAPALDDAADVSLPDLAQHVVDEAAAQGASERMVLVGYSMGGRVALEVARRYPDRLAALVLESAGLGPADEADRAAFSKRNAQLQSRLQEEGLEAFVDAWERLDLFASQHDLPNDVQQAVRADRLSCDAQRLAGYLEHAGAHTMPLASEARAMLERLACPVLYLAGERDTTYSSLARTLPATVQVRLFDAGHNVHLERPHAFVQALAHFMESFE